MLLGARQFFERRGAPTPSVPTARDYVQNGLIAMWDGIENAGWGVHDANATTWVDLSGNGADFQLGDKFKILDNGIEILDQVGWRGQGHPQKVTWEDTDNMFAEFVLDLTQVDKSIITGKNGVSFIGLRIGTGAGNTTSCPCVFVSQNGTFIHQGYAARPTIPFPSTPCSVSWQSGVSRYRMNGSFENSIIQNVGSPSIYYCPIISAYAGPTCPHAKILAIRLYANALTDGDSLSNYAIDKARFNLP